MAFSNLRKETSERSDSSNWAKKCLIANTPFHFDSIEGCNENAENLATHLFERARVDYDGHDDMNEETILQLIIDLETTPVLQRKINFAKALHVKLSYVLYCNGIDYVWIYEFEGINSLKRTNFFNSYPAFSTWIKTIKGWPSNKIFREKQDLPYFDKALRRAGTAWPTNIDCFISDANNNPIAILEFQNAHTVTVKEHCNNEYFLCKQSYINQNGYTDYHDDIRRWQSQEILRLQSGLRLIVITWQMENRDFILKEVDNITFPDLPFSRDWNLHSAYKKAMHDYASTRNPKEGRVIAHNFMSYNLRYEAPIMRKDIHTPPLSSKNQTFPFIYYKFKQLVTEHGDQLPVMLTHLLTNQYT